MRYLQETEAPLVICRNFYRSAPRDSNDRKTEPGHWDGRDEGEIEHLDGLCSTQISDEEEAVLADATNEEEEKEPPHCWVRK